MSCYEDKTESLHTLALNLAHLMNPNVKEMTAGEKKQDAKQETGSLEEQKQSSESDTIEQLQKYKGLIRKGSALFMKSAKIIFKWYVKICDGN